MHPDDIDPSLRPSEPLLDSLDDGFSPPAQATAPVQPQPARARPVEPSLGAKSPF
ncbi:hypothetical protein [Ramlibacter pallidus]|uniref:Uncharacterized protein n=1 Tax=Ramlibacter pallidus TaxID=2780087 RepID=A0ABR9RXI5_9BURK|nr:hypothetical protein [Ramlibacter pallidus]MBE7365965.1 hypothetical protein [Ramlibacter pallidus]